MFIQQWGNALCFGGAGAGWHRNYCLAHGCSHCVFETARQPSTKNIVLWGASGRRLYVQLKSGDSYLVRRASDGEEIFTVKNKRHLEYWTQHAYPVMLVIRQSNGLTRWMDVSAYLRANPTTSQIVFKGLTVTSAAIRDLAVTVKAANP